RWETMIIERLRGFCGRRVGAWASRGVGVVWVSSPPRGAPPPGGVGPGCGARACRVCGVPRAPEQLPQRAVLAALSVRRLAVADGPELRMAVHAGAARVDLAARGAVGGAVRGARDVSAGLLPVGDTLALPDRLLGHAGAGEILVSPAVTRRIEAWCELRG